MIKRYRGDEIHGFMFCDYRSDEPRWIDSADHETAIAALTAERDGYREHVHTLSVALREANDRTAVWANKYQNEVPAEIAALTLKLAGAEAEIAKEQEAGRYVYQHLSVALEQLAAAKAQRIRDIEEKAWLSVEFYKAKGLLMRVHSELSCEEVDPDDCRHDVLKMLSDFLAPPPSSEAGT